MDDLTLKDRAVLSVLRDKNWMSCADIRDVSNFDLSVADVGVSIAVLLERKLVRRKRGDRQLYRLTEEGVRRRNRCG